MTAAETHAPGPPPGPGVQPPFVAPPTDGTRQRRWFGLGLAGLALLVCCVGGLFGLGSLAVLSNRVTVDKSKAVVTDYLTAVRDRNFSQAYGLLCTDLQNKTSLGEFEAVWTARPAINSFNLGTPSTSNQDVLVPATISYGDGTTRTDRYIVTVNGSTGEFKVCGVQR